MYYTAEGKVMKKYYLVIFMLIGVLFNPVNAESRVDSKVIYKWFEDGLVNYSHIKPLHVKKVTKLDADGRAIEDFTEEFDEIISISVRPSSHAKQEKKNTVAEKQDEQSEVNDKEKRRTEQREKNCEIAKRNMKMLEGGEVYEKDAKGNMIRLKPEDIVSKQKNVARDVDYFCSESEDSKN